MGDASRVRVAIAEETTFGTAEPSGAGIYKYLRLNNETLKADFGNVQSQQLDPTRQPSVNIRTNVSASGDIVSEDSLITPAASNPINTITGFDPLIEGALMTDFSTIVALTAQNLVIGTPAGGVFAVTSSGTPFANVVVGDWIKLGGFATNGTIYGNVTIVTSSASITMQGVRSTGLAVTAETNTASGTVSGSNAHIGTTKKSYTIERQYTDLTTPEYSLYTGMRVGRWALRMTAQAIFEHTFSFTGKLQATTTTSVTGSPTAVWSTPILEAVDHFKMPMLGAFTSHFVATGAATARLSEINFTLDNKLRTEPELGVLGSTDIGIGTPTLEGTIKGYMASADLVRIAEAGTRSKVALRLDDGTRARIVSINSILFGSPDIGAKGRDQSVEFTLPFSSESDSAGYAITVARF